MSRSVATYYLAVTPDLYELPMAVAHTGAELAKMLGISEGTIYTQMVRNKPEPWKAKGTCKYRFRKTEIEEDDEENEFKIRTEK